jgi:two-component system, OmpR family, sensor histidine kinase BaeS
MQLRLFHKLFFLVALTALVASLAMAGVISLNLSRGFADYLDARDAEMLDSLVSTISASIEAEENRDALENGDLTIAGVVRNMARTGQIRGLRNLPPHRGADLPPLANGGAVSRFEAAPNRPPPRYYRSRRDRPPPPPGNFGTRLLLFDSNDVQVIGPRPPEGDLQNRMIERDITVDGAIWGKARLLPRGPSPDNVDARFLRSQYIGSAVLTLVLLILAGVAAFYFARAGAKRLGDMQKATDAIAHGDLDARVTTKGSDEIAAMGENINIMASSLAKLDSARRRWLAEIGHELRTPLTVLVGELDALQDGVRPINMAAVQSLSDEAKLLSRLVEDLHLLAVSDLSGPPCQFDHTDAVVLIKNVTARFSPQMEKAGLQLDADLGAYKSMPVYWDNTRIEQLLGTLLTNSERYTDAPGTVRVGLKREDEVVSISIEDSAPGVPAEHLPHLFEPLYRLDEARNRATGGSGLGLAVSQTIVRAHGGTITAAPSPMGGLLVEVRLPTESGA